jgi:3-dehydroquinate synthase
MTEPHRQRVSLGDRSYDILIGDGLLAMAGSHIAPVLRRPRTIIVTDTNVAALHLAALERSLADANIAHEVVVLPPGEQTKDFVHLEKLIARLLELKIERGTSLIALGGGVIGDLTGFAAAIVLRGVDFVQVPTTLLAQVDSSVGGKTGINTAAGKNLVGSFHQPRLVLADTSALSSLPRRQLLAGYAEVVKYGVIDRPEFFTWLEGHGTAVIEGDSSARRHAVSESCAAKAAIVAEDEHERGRRALLNLGHTFGHALEAETGFGEELLHGEAVAIGMVLALDLSVRLNLCPAEDSARLRRHLAAIGLATGIYQSGQRIWNPRRLTEHMARDKKVSDGRTTFVLAHGIGQAFLSDKIDIAEVEALLTDTLAA